MKSHNGDAVEEIYWPDGGFLTTAGETHELICCCECDDCWILEMKEGKEFARHNVKFIESIEWKL